MKIIIKSLNKFLHLEHQENGKVLFYWVESSDQATEFDSEYAAQEFLATIKEASVAYVGYGRNSG